MLSDESKENGDDNTRFERLTKDDEKYWAKVSKSGRERVSRAFRAIALRPVLPGTAKTLTISTANWTKFNPAEPATAGNNAFAGSLQISGFLQMKTKSK